MPRLSSYLLALVAASVKSSYKDQTILNPPLYCECGPKTGRGIKPPLIIPFPPPPPGFILPPAGIPHPKNKDSCPEDFKETKCKDCKPVSGWCSEGPQTGCPCRDECPAEDSKDVPNCSSASCEGEKGKCTTGPYADCNCKDICPDNEEEFIDCASDHCKSEDLATCKEGDYKGCKCLVATDDIINDDPGFEDAVKWWDQFIDVYSNIDKYAPKADTKCSSSSNTKAVAIEKSTAYKVGDKFCSDLDLSKETKKDLTTKDIGISNSDYYVFHFEYKPGKSCFSDCKSTIRSMVCSGYDDHTIQPESKATFKCGSEYSFSFSVPDKAKFPTAVSTTMEPAKPTASLGQRTCFLESRRPASIYGGVRPDQYAAAADKACTAFSKHSKIEANNGRGSYVYRANDGPVPYWFNVGVNSLDNHSTCDQNLEDPLGDGSHKCSTILKDDVFKACNNGGRGGYIKVGCLVYSFDVCSGKGDIPNEAVCFASGMDAPEVVS
ncbi:uncharacterized protein N7498_002826 [Penicillium cinerascens]|uniref:Uncharacterized protein n=1 Tax=Penicillium cinerascens TaxID=70096 RepID=A0A9W9NAT6_9EURO|nr:uncharacterized protein N7498_002826 [Penicillium cinerascens]KAJ5216419.1 hypothetical protein N7498_002826 [Penicillium cinerascens]